MLDTILAHYSLPAPVEAFAEYGNGHIHETYRIRCQGGDSFILQRLNTRVFPAPEAVMRNIELVTAHLRARVSDPRAVLTIVPTKSGASFCKAANAYWRMFCFVSDSFCLEHAETPDQLSECAAGFAGFIRQLLDFDASQLAETIPHFHDTPARFEALFEAARLDAAGRLKNVRREVDEAYAYEPFAHTFASLQEAGELPLRVTHNDTKINNLLFDKKAGKALCVIDLDTVMPGLSMNDFGDAIRFAASTAEEDARDLSRVRLDLKLYEAYLTGFCRVCGGSLTRIERMLLPTGAKMMTLETGVRFLTDYLSGDTYFHTRYPEHNLDRARTQFALVRDMDQKWDEMQRITKSCINSRACTERA